MKYQAWEYIESFLKLLFLLGGIISLNVVADFQENSLSICIYFSYKHKNSTFCSFEILPRLILFSVGEVSWSILCKSSTLFWTTSMSAPLSEIYHKTFRFRAVTKTTKLFIWISIFFLFILLFTNAVWFVDLLGNAHEFAYLQDYSQLTKSAMPLHIHPLYCLFILSTDSFPSLIY